MSNKKSLENNEKLVCGLVMPISSIDGCNEQHWVDIKDIISEAIKDAGFTPNLVSYADDVGIIQKRIIQNLYDNPIVVCDVSGKNPNVMFELGLRLAFDKPTIIIKDDKTSYSFDTSPIEHLDYPRDLRFTKIIEFKQNLKEKLIATYKKSQDDKDYTTFLKHFGSFTVAKLDTKELSKEDFIIEELKELRKSITRQEKNTMQQDRHRYLYDNTARLPTDGFDNRIHDNDRLKSIADFVHDELSKYPISKRKNMSKNLKNEIRQSIFNKYPIDNEEDLERIDQVIHAML